MFNNNCDNKIHNYICILPFMCLSSIENTCKYCKNKNKNNIECAICLEILTKNVKKLSCNHIFHKKCIVQWKRKSNTCPLCRKVNI
jgi:hypothetical protein